MKRTFGLLVRGKTNCLLAALLLGLFGALPASAQLRVELALDQEQYLPGETISVSVRITNLSGQPVTLGEDPDWLTFIVERKENSFIVPKSADAPVAGGFTIGSSITATKRVNIAPYFNIAQPGRYNLSANIKIPQWQREINAKGRIFDIVTGSKIWEQEFGIPQSEPGAAPVMRRYALIQAGTMKEIKLYARVADATETQVFRVFPLGSMVSFSKPEAQVDQTSRLHVLHQNGARTFNYSVVDPDGREVVKETYLYTQTRPVLRGDGEGKVFVGGGMRRGDSANANAPGAAANAVRR